MLSESASGVPVADVDENRLPDEFAAHQIKTTANFATQNKLVSWLVGGLNFQIEHHLFPTMSHVHHRQVSKIVKSTALEFGLPYHSQPTFLKALKNHAQMLLSLSK